MDGCIRGDVLYVYVHNVVSVKSGRVSVKDMFLECVDNICYLDDMIKLWRWDRS